MGKAPPKQFDKFQQEKCCRKDETLWVGNQGCMPTKITSLGKMKVTGEGNFKVYINLGNDLHVL